MTCERFLRTIPSHSHGSGSYEIHYIPTGYGKLTADGHIFDIGPNTLFVTGPHVEHAQAPRSPFCGARIFMALQVPGRAGAPGWPSVNIIT